MKAYSEDLRLRIVAAVDGGMPRSEAARVFGVGRATVKRYLALRRETGGLDPQKKTLSAVERDEAARAAWRERCAGVDPRRFVFVDETGSHLGLVRLYARAPRGERARGRAPRNRGRTRTTVAAVTLRGMGPGLVVEGGISTAGFEAYVQHLLAPTLRPGDIVVTDNLAQHHGARTRDLIEAR